MEAITAIFTLHIMFRLKITVRCEGSRPVLKAKHSYFLVLDAYLVCSFQLYIVVESNLLLGIVKTEGPYIHDIADIGNRYDYYIFTKWQIN